MKFDYGDLVAVVDRDHEHFGEVGIVVMVDDDELPYGVAFGITETALNSEELRIERYSEPMITGRSWYKQASGWDWMTERSLELQLSAPAPNDDIVITGDIDLSLLLG